MSGSPAFRLIAMAALLLLPGTLSACAGGADGPTDASVDADGSDAGADGGDSGAGDADPGDGDPGDVDPGDGDLGDGNSGDGDGELADGDGSADQDLADGGGDDGPLCPDQAGLPGDFGHSTASTTAQLGTPPVDLPLTIFLPAGTGPYPVVVFLHGFQLSPELYASYGAHLASWGYLVIMPQMPGTLFNPTSHSELKSLTMALLDWIAAEAGAASGPLAGKGDAARIGLAGHSLGGKIALLVSTEDARPRAVFGVDPVDAAAGPFGTPNADYPSVTPELMGAIDVPLALLGETTNASCTGAMCQACAPEEDNFQQYYLHAASPAIEIEVLGANHMSFLDDPDCGLTCTMCPKGDDDPAVTRALTRKYMTAFFQLQLRGEETHRCHLTGSSMAADASAGLVVAATKNDF